MRDFIEKIRDKNILLIFKILFIGLTVFFLLFLSDRELTREVSLFFGGDAKADPAGTARAEDETEALSEGQSEALTPAELAMPEDEDAQNGIHSYGGGSEISGNGISILLENICQIPVDFHIPMAMPEGQREEIPTKLWTVTSGSGEEDETPAECQIVEYQDGLSFQQWQTVNKKYKIVSAGKTPPFDLLKRMVENRIGDYDGDWSVYVKNLKTDESFVVNDRPMKSASVMKLFILGTVYKAIEDGELERTDELVSLMNNMITASDNEASNRLLYLLGDSSYADGIAQVDAFIQKYGFSSMTVEYNGFNDSDTILDAGHSNQVSAKDCGKLLEDIYRRAWLSRAEANEIERMMLDQQTRYKIPAGLPDGVSCGNKTGEMETTENDAAVVYAEDCDYILVVLSSDWSNKDQAISRIASMSEMVYEFLN